MHLVVAIVLWHFYSCITLAQPQHHRHHHHLEERELEEVVEIKEIIEIWDTVTVSGPEPSDPALVDLKAIQKTRLKEITWWTNKPDSTGRPSGPPTAGNGGEEKKEEAKLNVQASSSMSTSSQDTSSTNTIQSSSVNEGVIDAKPLNTQTTSHAETSNAPTANEDVQPTPTGSQSLPSSSSKATSPSEATSSKYPFSALVAFGDNLSDNGNGSYAHHVADQNNPFNTIYGAKTWTNAQVAVSFLTDLLGVPMTQNFAFGHAWGGSDAGATLDNTMFVSDFHNATVAAELGCPGAPPASQQVSTYISQGVNKDALHFLWIGNNDVDMVGFYQQEAFNANLTAGFKKVVQQLLDAGAPYVFVPNIYPKQLAPVVPKYYGWTTQSQQDDFGKSITQANTVLKDTLDGLNSDKIIYYDANSFLTQVWNNAGSYGLTNAKDTNGWPAFCDGDPDQTQEVKDAIAAGTINPKDPNNWGICVDDSKQDEWYWMQYLDPTSRVHELLAGDMNKAIAAHFGQSA